MRLITKTLDLPNTLNHDILRRHADQPTIHDRLMYLAKRWYSINKKKDYTEELNYECYGTIRQNWDGIVCFFAIKALL